MHQLAEDNISRKLWITIILNFGITFFQTIAFIWSGSLSLLSDALHNFSDVFSLIISLIASKIARKKYSYRATFGYRRSEVLAAFINTILLFMVAGFLIKEAFVRLFFETDVTLVDPFWVALGALVSIVGNFLSVIILHSRSKDNINVQSSYLHLLSDLFTSFAVLLGAGFMYYFQLPWIDALLSILIAIYLLTVAIRLLLKSAYILMQFSPIIITDADISETLSSYPEIKNIHHLHIWEMSKGRTMLMAHIDFKENVDLKTANDIMKGIEQDWKKKYDIFEMNLQPEINYHDDKSLIVQG